MVKSNKSHLLMVKSTVIPVFEWLNSSKKKCRWPKQIPSQALGRAAAGDLRAAFGRTPEPAARVGGQGAVKHFAVAKLGFPGEDLLGKKECSCG